MTTEQAINILNEQIESLRWVNSSTQKTWITQTKSEIEKIFGAGSPESLFLITFKFDEPMKQGIYGMKFPNDSDSNKTAIDFLQRCIQTLKRKKAIGETKPNVQYIEKPVIKEVIREVVKEVMVYPPKKKYFISFIEWIRSRDAISFISFALLVLGLPFWFGWYLGENKADIQNIDLRKENRQLMNDTSNLGIQYRKLVEAAKISLPLDVTNNKPDSNAKSNQKKKNPDTAHK